jgi:4,5-dihydroxyphthalate decarboxylase
MKLQLSIGITDNPRTRPVIDGTVRPEAIDLLPTVLHPSELFWRQLRFAEFDIAEMSMSSFLMARAHGDDRFVGLPVFTTRRLFHTGILVRRDAGIASPVDLRGKRVGVPEYQQTAALWTRGALLHEFGVAPCDMEFWMERDPSRSHGGATGFAPPPGVVVHTVAADTSLGAMMQDGTLDAAIHYIRKQNLVDRSTADLHHDPAITTLFADPRAEGARYFAATGLYPINHGMVVRKSLWEAHPWVVLNLLNAFRDANEIAERQRMEHVLYHLEAGLLPAGAAEALRRPLIQHGVGVNRRTLETIAAYSHEQGLTPRRLGLEELFAPNVMDQ